MVRSQVILSVSSVSSRLGSMEFMVMIALERDSALRRRGGRAQAKLLAKFAKKPVTRLRPTRGLPRRYGLSLDAFDDEDDAKHKLGAFWPSAARR